MFRAGGKYWIGFLAWVLLIGFFSLSPKSLMPLPHGRDKVVHFLFYIPFGVFGFYHPRRSLRMALLIALFGANAGLLLELLQRRVPGRVCDGYDFLADALGISAGLICFGLWLWLHKRRLGWQARKS